MSDENCCGACGYPIHATKDKACDWCRQTADRIEALTAEPHAEGEAWGILNPYGRLWTHNTFPSEDAARRHVEAFWRGNPNAGDYVRGLKPVRVNVRVTLAEIEGEQT
jgi:hypothetical protein